MLFFNMSSYCCSVHVQLDWECLNFATLRFDVYLDSTEHPILTRSWDYEEWTYYTTENTLNF